MTVSHSQPATTEPYQHVCPDVDCIYYGKPTNGGMCGCHRTREQVMAARIEELTKALDDSQGLLVMIYHIGSAIDKGRISSANWANEELEKQLAEQIGENSRALAPSLEQEKSHD